MRAVVKALLLLVVLGVVILVAVFIWIDSRGISAKAQPGRVETVIARTMRRFAMPRSARDLKNPVAASPSVLAEGMAHYADHCASCHANNGSGETELGLGLYPKPPDMRLEATQALTDGELFYIIENGVRLTGMPAWSTDTDDGRTATWHLVHFIRHLPTLTEAEIDEMKTMNPLSPEDLRQQREAERFLRGEDPEPAPQSHGHGGGHE